MKRAEQEAIRWVLQAQDDQRFVEWIREEGVFFDKGCFVAQQAAEKAMKACLYSIGRRQVIGHSIVELCADLKGVAPGFASLGDAARRLDRFYIPTRYPNGLPGGVPCQVYSMDDLEEASEDLSKILATTMGFLREKGILSEGGT